MNNKQITCDPSRIELFLSQQLDDIEQAAFELHLDECVDCRSRLEEAAASEEIWSGVRNSLQDQKLPTDYLRSEESSSDSPSGDTSFNLDAVIDLLSPTDDDRMIGRLGAYEVLGVIGSGGMGVVLKAFDAALNRYVAIKILSPHLGSSGAARKRFSREAQAAAAVVHDNVIEIYGVSDVNGLPYLVMPYVRDPSLQRRLDKDGPLALVEILRVGMQTAAGLAAAHAQGLVHRDVKPANILLADGVERVKLADFGLARAADDASLTMTGIIAGTPQYMSPEQACGDSVDQRSDLFSLGSVLYAMATGRMPFRAETSYGVLRRITDQEPKPIREINPDIPEWLCDIITKLMSKQPEERFASASEVAELLEECLAHVQQPTVVPLPKEVRPHAIPFIKSEGRFPLSKVLWGAAFAFITFFAGLLILLELNKGTLTIECDADDIPIRITQGDTIVKELTVTSEGKKVRIAAGTYLVEIDGKFDGISIAGGTVKLKRGKTKVVRIVKKEDTAPETVTLKPAVIPTTSTKSMELEGTWNIIAAPAAGTLGFHPIIKSVKVTGNIWTYQKHGRVSSFYRELILDSNSSPKKIDWVIPGRLGEMLPARGLYRLKGDNLEIAINKNSEYIRPKSFDAPDTIIQTWERVLDEAKEKRITSVKINSSGLPKESDISSIIWDRLGLKIEAVSLGNLPSKKYRGGMKILALRSNSPATKAGIRVDDILVGLNSWETTSFENLRFVMDQFEDQPEIKESRDIKFYILRDKETLFGNLEIPTTQKNKLPDTDDSSGKLISIDLTQGSFSDNGFVLEGKLEPNTEIVLQIEKSAHSKKMEWTSRLKAGGPVTVSVTRSDKIKLGDNKMGQGLVFAAEVNGIRDRAKIAMVENGPIPYGPILFKTIDPAGSTTSEILQKSNSFHFADIILKDGLKVPLTILFRKKESNSPKSLQPSQAPIPPIKKEPPSLSLQLKPAKPTLSIQEAADLHDAIMSLKEEIRGCEEVLKKSPEDRMNKTLLKKARSRLAFYRKGLAAKIQLLEIELKDGESAVLSAEESLELKKRHYKTGFTPISEVLKTQRDVEATKLRVEHSRTLLELYHDIEPPEQKKSQLWNEYGVTPAPVSPVTAKVLEWIGLHLRPITKKQFRGKNVFSKYEGGLDVTFVRSHGPAEKAGVHEVDIVVTIQGQAVLKLEDLDLATQGIIEKNKKKETASIDFGVLRDGKTVTLQLPIPLSKALLAPQTKSD